MKRINGLYDAIHDYENLRLAFCKAAKGKSDRKDVIAFRRRFDDNIQSLRDQLVACEPVIGRYQFFTVWDPKRRTICAASFPERVLHHAVMNICEPYLDNRAVFDSYACRKGKGQRKAIERAQYFSKKHRWHLKLDVRKYFDSIDQGILMALLRRVFKDKRLLVLFEGLLATYSTAPGKGVPIGNLISQHLANFYLCGFDHWVKETLRVRGYLRYMDDLLFFGRERETLKTVKHRVVDYLDDHLALETKDEGQLNRCDNGIPFLGYRIYPGVIRLSPAGKRRFIRKFRQYENNWLTGKWDVDALTRHMEPLIDFTRAADATAFRRNVIERYGLPYDQIGL